VLAHRGQNAITDEVIPLGALVGEKIQRPPSF
jgi:hypothetical protein